MHAGPTNGRIKITPSLFIAFITWWLALFAAWADLRSEVASLRVSIDERSEATIEWRKQIDRRVDRLERKHDQ